MFPSLRSRLQHGETLHGSIVSLPCPAAAEILAEAGFDWLFVDAEHGALDLGHLTGILQAVGHRLPCIVRVPVSEEEPIKRILDLGASGIIAPQVNSTAHARLVVEHARYAPMGHRGVGIGRAHGYGAHFKNYVEQANEAITVIIQVEHIEAVQCIESTAALPGVDGILLGPYDLASSMGRMGEVDHPEVIEAIDHVLQVCHSVQMPVGYFGVEASAVAPYRDKGCRLLVTGADCLFLLQAAKKELERIKTADNQA
jgi:2-keto-3-deoxy-L-rhamnonate aldolase RhmA